MRLLFALISLMAGVSFAQINLDSMLVAHYPFEGNGNDLSTFGINATTSGESYSTGVYGAPNSAIVFDGTVNSYADAGTDNRTISDTITVSAFVRTTFDGIGDIVSKYDPGSDEGYHLQISLGKIRFAGRDGGGTYHSTGFSLTDINDSSWHHIMGVVRGNTWLLYVDCTLEGAQSNSTMNPDLSSNAQLGIGKDVFSDQKYLDCEVDEVRIYNRQLWQDEMDSLCATAVFASLPGTKNKEVHFNMYPNPAQDKIAIATDENLAGSQIEIYDLSGKLVLSQEAVSHTPIIDISSLSNGTYVLHLKSNTGLFSERLSIQR